MLPESVLNMTLGELLRTLVAGLLPPQALEVHPPAPAPALPLPAASAGPRLVTIQSLCSGRQWPTPAAFRWLLYRESPGLEACIHRVGRRILVDEDAFWQWARAQDRVPPSSHQVSPASEPTRRRGRPRRVV